MSEQEGEKSFAPSEKRKSDAAKRGDVIRPRELAIAVTVAISAVWLLLAGPWIMDACQRILRSGFTFNRADIDGFNPGAAMLDAMLAVLPPIMVLGVAVIAVSLVAQLSFGEGRWIGANMAPKGSRLNPLSGLKRIFGPNGWIEMAKGVAKVGLLGMIAWMWAENRIQTFTGLGRGDVLAQLSWAWNTIILLLFWLAAGLFIIAFFDLPVQLVRRMLRLKMTLQDVRDEQKQSEGAPEKKAMIRDRQRKIASGGLIPAIQDAQFVVTNPMHFAVAFAYDPAKAAAPVVVAKGRGDKALAIRHLALDKDVPVLEYPILARSVYFSTREKQVIREEHYVAVAALLAFVLALKRGEKRVAPEVSVPVTLRFDADGRLDPTIS